MNVGKYILSLAAKEGYSQSDVARRTGISRQMLSYIIAGERKLTLPQALKIESLFALKTGTLIFMQDEDYIKNIRIVYNRKNEMRRIGKRNAMVLVENEM